MSRSSEQASLLSLVGLPFDEGARGPEAYDCLGIVLRACDLYSMPTIDPWRDLRDRWQAGDRDLAMFTGFPEGWARVENHWHALPRDVAIFTVASAADVPGHLGFVDEDFHVLSSRQQVGVYRTPFAEVVPRVIQLWRYTP